MTQTTIPGCEADPDPTTVINVDPTKPIKEIPMDELKRDCDTDKKMQDSFDTLLVSSANAAENGKELLEENKRLNEECEQLVQKNHELYDEVVQLRSENEDLTAENEKLKDELAEEKGKNHSAITLRALLPLIRYTHIPVLHIRKRGWKNEEEWTIKSKENGGNSLISVLEKAQFVDGNAILDNPATFEIYYDGSMNIAVWLR